MIVTSASADRFELGRAFAPPFLVRARTDILVSLVLRGTAQVRHGHLSAEVRAGELLVCPAARPYGHGVEQVLMRVPRARAPRLAERLDRLVARPIPGDTGYAGLLAGMLARIADDHAGFAESDKQRLNRVLLDLLAGMAGQVLGQEEQSARRTLLPLVQRHIRAHLHDPDLTPRSVAAAHHMSLRTLQRLFQQDGLTVSAWIRLQRLEGCRRDLADPLQRHLPIHAVAARWGFPRAADFTRAFRAQYGMPPSRLRRSGPAQAAPALPPPPGSPAWPTPPR
ncbi:MAG: helix-turn-helix domain-containing protein [Nonomuraea sp.]|nr:helix-turn-helix domain-containing protein [Nonomuraea sp.]